MEIRFDFRGPGLIGLHNALHELARVGVPYATRNTLTRSAFVARSEWTRQLFFQMTLRNRYTERSLRVEPARGTNVASMEAKVGSVAEYMARREEGAIELPKRGSHVPIATPVASGEGRGRERMRLVRSQSKLANISLNARIGATKKQRNAIAIDMARRSGKRFAFIEGERASGIVRVGGGKRRPRIDMVWNLSKSAVRVPPFPTLQMALERTKDHVEDIAVRALLEQIDRHLIRKMRGA